MCFQWQCKSQRLSLAIPLSWQQQVGLSILLNAKKNKRKYWQSSACPLLAGQSFPEGLPWQTSLFLADKSSATDSCVVLQPIQAKIFESFQKAKTRQSWDVQPLILLVSNMGVDWVQGNQRHPHCGSREVNIGISEPAESARLEKQTSGTLSADL